MINKSDKPLARMIKTKRRFKSPISRMTHDIDTDTEAMTRIIWDNYEQL